MEFGKKNSHLDIVKSVSVKCVSVYRDQMFLIENQDCIRRFWKSKFHLRGKSFQVQIGIETFMYVTPYYMA